MFIRFIFCFLFLFSFLLAEERFLLVDGMSNKTLLQVGLNLDERFSPCSTFKIPLSLMGYDAGILKDEQRPVWEFQEGYDDFLDTWKGPQGPQSWMQHSCVWYSKLISCRLGLNKMQKYLAAFNYGNQDLSVGIVGPGKADPAWFPSSPLRISVKEQVQFLRKMLQHKLGVTNHAVAMTKNILFKEQLPQDWKLFGKTGWSGSIDRKNPTVLQYAWFIGWIEKNEHYFPFAYFIREEKVQLDQRIPRTIQLLNDSGVMKNF
jgi:beta-lactamase class D